jgi:hypothetical protein
MVIIFAKRWAALQFTTLSGVVRHGNRKLRPPKPSTSDSGSALLNFPTSLTSTTFMGSSVKPHAALKLGRYLDVQEGPPSRHETIDLERLQTSQRVCFAFISRFPNLHHSSDWASPTTTCAPSSGCSPQLYPLLQVACFKFFYWAAQMNLETKSAKVCRPLQLTTCATFFASSRRGYHAVHSLSRSWHFRVCARLSCIAVHMLQLHSVFQ